MNSNVGRPLEFDPDAALDAAMGVFWSHGYEHTSMQDLLEAMDLSKSSLYQAFGGKQALFRRCLAHYADMFVGQLREKLAISPSGRQFIEDFLHSALEDTHSGEPRGCLVMNTASEFAQSDPAIATDVARSIKRFRDTLRLAVERAQREGEIAPDRDPRVLASYLVSSMSGLKNQAKAGIDAKTLKDIIQVVLRALD